MLYSAHRKIDSRFWLNGQPHPNAIENLDKAIKAATLLNDTKPLIPCSDGGTCSDNTKSKEVNRWRAKRWSRLAA